MAPLVPLKSAYDVAINSSMYACLSVRSRISKTHKFKLYRIRVHVASRRGLVLYNYTSGFVDDGRHVTEIISLNACRKCKATRHIYNKTNEMFRYISLCRCGALYVDN